MANLYLVSRPEEDVGYDEYDSFIVAHNSEEEAVKCHPSSDSHGYSYYKSWPKEPNATATLVGTAKDDTPVGTVILASFNAG